MHIGGFVITSQMFTLTHDRFTGKNCTMSLQHNNDSTSIELLFEFQLWRNILNGHLGQLLQHLN